MSRTAVFAFGLALALLTCTVVFATPYVPPETLQQQLEERQRTQPPGPQVPPTPFPEIPFYEELDEYEEDWDQLLNWLPELQVDDQGPNFGGQREGEQDWNIIQTDNTQEALRDWARYGYLTGDTATFSEYIANAWIYCEEWPAWQEEGGGNPNYYRVHNAGWGCVAAMEYFRAYGDSSWLWYGDECADYLDTYRLTITNTTTGINPLSAGYGAGALYLYGVWRDSAVWIDAAQDIAEDVQSWIEYDPERLNDHETWAMSGGTAMWGVVTALFADDPEGGAEWIPDYTEYMDLYSGPGNWNNSWTVWYAHAWNAIYRVMGDTTSINNVIWITDWLLEQDEPDDDGGIPATEDQWQNDQSWTTAYLAWYTLELLLDLPPDAEPVGLAHPAVDTLFTGLATPFEATVRNAGMEPLEDVEVELEIGDYEASALVTLGPLQDTTVTLDPAWIPDEAGTFEALLTVFHPLDSTHANDSLTMELEVTGASFVSGYVTAEEDGAPVQAELLLWNDPEVGGYHYVTNSDCMGFYAFRLPWLDETQPFYLEVYPTEGDYAALDAGFHELPAYSYLQVDVEVDTADVLFIQEGVEGIYDNPLAKSLLQLGEAFRPMTPWTQGYPDTLIHDYPLIIWSCLSYEDDIYPSDMRNEIDIFFENGGSMLLHGSGLQNKWGGFYYMETRFGIDAGLMDSLRQGIGSYHLLSTEHWGIMREGDLTTFGDSLDATVPFPNATAIVTLNDDAATPVAVAYQPADTSYRAVTAGFEIEQLVDEGGAGPAIDRPEFVEDVLAWLRWETDVIGDDPAAAATLPAEFGLHAYPNPFNPALTVEVALPEAGDLRVEVFDVLGRLVTSWAPGRVNAGTHAYHWKASGVASGVYFVVLEHPKGRAVQRVMLLR